MNKVQEVYEKLMKINLSELMITASMAIQSNLDEDRLSVILLALQERLLKRSMLVRMKMNLEIQDTK